MAASALRGVREGLEVCRKAGRRSVGQSPGQSGGAVPLSTQREPGLPVGFGLQLLEPSPNGCVDEIRGDHLQDVATETSKLARPEVGCITHERLFCPGQHRRRDLIGQCLERAHDDPCLRDVDAALAKRSGNGAAVAVEGGGEAEVGTCVVEPCVGAVSKPRGRIAGTGLFCHVAGTARTRSRSSLTLASIRDSSIRAAALSSVAMKVGLVSATDFSVWPMSVAAAKIGCWAVAALMTGLHSTTSTTRARSWTIAAPGGPRGAITDPRDLLLRLGILTTR